MLCNLDCTSRGQLPVAAPTRATMIRKTGYLNFVLCVHCTMLVFPFKGLPFENAPQFLLPI